LSKRPKDGKSESPEEEHVILKRAPFWGAIGNLLRQEFLKAEKRIMEFFDVRVRRN